MRFLVALLLGIFTSQLPAAYATGTVAVYDFEQNLTDTAGGYNGSLSGSGDISYVSSSPSPFHGSYSARSTTAAITLPNGVMQTLDSTGNGTVELVFTPRSISSGNTPPFRATGTGSSFRELEIQFYLGNFYIFADNSTLGYPSAYGVSNDTRYYVAYSWKSDKTIKAYIGSIDSSNVVTMYGTITSATTNALSFATITSVVVGPNTPGAVDWLRISNVYKDIADLPTIDPSTSPAAERNPWLKDRLRLRMKGWLSQLMDILIFPASSHAQPMNGSGFGEWSKNLDLRSQNVAKQKVLAADIFLGKVTLTTTPTPIIGSPTPTVTPTPTLVSKARSTTTQTPSAQK